MRPEKKYLVEEVDRQIGDTSYLFLADYKGITVAETAELRESLAAQGAEFHVVKNSILGVVTKARNMPDFSSLLSGPTAVVSGGANPSEVAKVLTKFHKAREKVELKGGSLGNRFLEQGDIIELSNLPSLEVLRAQLLGLLNTPAQQCVRVLQAVPQGMLNVLQARRDQGAA
jgi:large subunit ribosomal protein L10